MKAISLESGQGETFVRDVLERGRIPSIENFMSLADVLKLSVSILIGEENEADQAHQVTQVPLLSWVSAGKLADPATQIPLDEVPFLAFADLGRGDFFALTVDGDSMDRVSPHGSIIVVNRSDHALVSGRCYVFAVRGEITYKRWQDDDTPYLEPFSTNPTHKVTLLKRKRDLEVVGRVRRTLLDL